LANPNQWLEQQLNKMAAPIATGQTRRLGVRSCEDGYAKEIDIVAAVKVRGWRVLQIELDYVFVRSGYSIRDVV
jgi:hypothetical protein